jgi:hypothetical protein
MLAAGLIQETGEPATSDAEHSRRRYYRITSRGRRAATAEIARLESAVKQARARFRALKLRT